MDSGTGIMTRRNTNFCESLRSNRQNTLEQNAKEIKSQQLQELLGKVKSLHSSEIHSRSSQWFKVIGPSPRIPAQSSSRISLATANLKIMLCRIHKLFLSLVKYAVFFSHFFIFSEDNSWDLLWLELCNQLTARSWQVIHSCPHASEWSKLKDEFKLQGH